SKKGSLLYLSGLPKKLNENDKKLVEIFARNVQIAFDNVLLTKELEDTQREIIERLGQAMEQQNEHGRHILRMVKISQLLAKELGLSQQEVDTLGLSVPLHDIGKIKIPDAVIFKKEQLSTDDIQLIRRHADFGYNLLKDSKRPLIKAAAIIARDHHEFWDGRGYPRGKSGESIHIYCRITALVDAYDVMRHKHSYKNAWTTEQSMEVVLQQKGKQFDPHLVDIFQENIRKIEEIITSYPDFE
ncbi:MAG: HD domain-containing phosphohydrolase, partial [Paraglaciecola sp.]